MSFMKTEWQKYSLIDTNVLVYAVDPTDEFKHELANELFESAFEKDSKFAISTQIMAEFANVCYRLSKHNQNVGSEDAETVLTALMEITDMPKLTVLPQTIFHAMKIQGQPGISFFDALIAATMNENGITTIYTEDKGFEKIAGITVINPFAKTI